MKLFERNVAAATATEHLGQRPSDSNIDDLALEAGLMKAIKAVYALQQSAVSSAAQLGGDRSLYQIKADFQVLPDLQFGGDFVYSDYKFDLLYANDTGYVRSRALDLDRHGVNIELPLVNDNVELEIRLGAGPVLIKVLNSHGDLLDSIEAVRPNVYAFKHDGIHTVNLTGGTNEAALEYISTTVRLEPIREKISDLIGMEHRSYNTGDSITKGYKKDRVNFEINPNNGTIVNIWFG